MEPQIPDVYNFDAQDYQTYQNYMSALVELLRREFFLQIYEIRIQYPRYEDISKDVQECIAYVEGNSSYYFVTLNFAPKVYQRWRDKGYYEIVKTAVHEIIHVVSMPVIDALQDAADSPTTKKLYAHMVEQMTSVLTEAYMAQTSRGDFSTERLLKIYEEDIKPRLKRHGEQQKGGDSNDSEKENSN